MIDTTSLDVTVGIAETTSNNRNYANRSIHPLANVHRICQPDFELTDQDTFELDENALEEDKKLVISFL